MRQTREKPTSLLCSSHDVESDKRETETLGYKAKCHERILQGAIFSPDRLIRDFLQGILAYQGYKCIRAADLKDNVLDLYLPGDQVVFIDGAYWSAGHDPDHLRNCVNLCAQEGVHILVLTSRKGESDLKTIQKMSGCQLLWKPLDYRQVGQVMGLIGFGTGEG